MCNRALLSIVTLFSYYLILKSLFITLRLVVKKRRNSFTDDSKIKTTTTTTTKYRKSYPLKGLHKHKRMITCSNVQDITSSGLKLNQVLRATPLFRLQPSRSFFSSSFLEDQLLLSFDDLFIPRSSTFNGLEGKTIRDRRGKIPKFRKQDTLLLLYIKLAY